MSVLMLFLMILHTNFFRLHEYGRGGQEGGVWGTIRGTLGSK